MSKLFFSIIIPTLNEEVALPVLLKNLVNQTCKSFEVIIVDGNSKDKTRQKALRFQTKLNLKFIQVKKRNVSYQRNFGAGLARTKYLIFFDADTEIPRDFLKKINNCLNHKKPDLLTTWIRTKERGIRPIETGSNLIFEISKGLELPALYGSMVAVKKSVFEKVHGFNENIDYKEDSDLAQRIYKQGFKYIILRNTYYYWSLRRFEKLGTLKTLQKYFLLNLGKTLDYPMGGHILTDKSKASEFGKLVNNLIDRFKLK